jgi:NADPH:quinone reductase-like Zn-dependent oxidoreductase
LARGEGVRLRERRSAGSADLIRSLGADVFIDYHAQKFEDVANDVDLVLDTVGGETLARSWAVLKPGGTLASIVQPPDPAAAEQANAKGVMVYGHVDATARAKLTELIEAGHVRPVIDQTFSLEQIADAHRYVETGHAHGKVVLRVDGSIA